MSAPVIDAPSASPETPPTNEPPPRTNPVVAIATWSANHRWLALGLWVAFLAAAVVGGGAVQGQDLDERGQTIGLSAGADDALRDADFGDLESESILIQGTNGAGIDSASTNDAVTDLTESVSAIPGVEAVSEPIPSDDGTALLIEAALAETEGNGDEQYEAHAGIAADIDDVVGNIAADHPDLALSQVGTASLGAAVEDVINADFEFAGALSIPVTLIILAVVFGALIAASVPVLLAFSSVLAALGLSTFASYLVPTSELLGPVVLLIGMAVGVDYSLFYVRRSREQRAGGDPVGRSIEIAAATSGRAIVVSGMTTAVAMSGLFFTGMAVFNSFAVGTILVIAVAVVGSLTVLPALLALLGPWVDRPRIPLLWRLTRKDTGSRFWSTILRPVLRRPAVAFTVGVVSLGGLAVPAVSMTLAEPGIDGLPESISERDTLDDINAAFPQEGDGHMVAVWTQDGSALDGAGVEAAVADLAESAANDPLFPAAGVPDVDIAASGDVARFTVPVDPGLDHDGEQVSVETLRELLGDTFGAMPNTAAGVTGEIAIDVDFRNQLSDRLPVVIGFVMALTIVVLTVAFRSVVMALTAAALNLLSVGAAYGILVLVFQNSWAEGLLGFTSTGGIVTWIPILLFVILFGVSMDYHIFVVSRIREARMQGMDTGKAIEHGVTASAGVVTSAAVVMIAVFSIFAMLSMIEFKQMGVGLAVAILIDATVVRAIILPSAMRLLGESNWWLPRPLAKVLPGD